MSDRLQLDPAVLLEIQTAGEDLIERVTWLKATEIVCLALA